MTLSELQLYESLDLLPAPPSQVARVLERAGQASAMDYNIVHIIQYDPAIASRVLKISNSRLYGYPSQIGSLQQAAGLLGPGVIKSIILTTPILERYTGDQAEYKSRIDFDRMWRHSSIAGAMAGRLGALWNGFEADVCFTSGLLHDLGKIALAVVHPRLFMESVDQARKDSCSLNSKLKEVSGLTTRDIGGFLAKKWLYPDQLLEVFDNPESGSPPAKTLGTLAQLSSALADHYGYDDGLGLTYEESLPDLCEALGKSSDDLKAYESDLRNCASVVMDAKSV